MDTPQAWETLDLRADLIGRRTMKSGRQSVLSTQPLFFLARSVVKQVQHCFCLALWRVVGNTRADRLRLSVEAVMHERYTPITASCHSVQEARAGDSFVGNSSL